MTNNKLLLSLKYIFAVIILSLAHITIFAQSSRSLYVGDETFFSPPSPPQGAIYEAVWSSSQNGLRVTKDGIGATVKVTHYFSGIGQVRCDYYWRWYINGRQYTNHATTYFNITCKQVNVILNESSITLYEGEGIHLSYSFSPQGAASPSVYWSSSNSNIASVNNNGYVTARKKGSATIKVETDQKTSATCIVTVHAKTSDNNDQGNDSGNGSGNGSNDSTSDPDDDNDDNNENSDNDSTKIEHLDEWYINRAKERIKELKAKTASYIKSKLTK